MMYMVKSSPFSYLDALKFVSCIAMLRYRFLFFAIVFSHVVFRQGSLYTLAYRTD